MNRDEVRRDWVEDENAPKPPEKKSNKARPIFQKQFMEKLEIDNIDRKPTEAERRIAMRHSEAILLAGTRRKKIEFHHETIFNSPDDTKY